MYHPLNYLFNKKLNNLGIRKNNSNSKNKIETLKYNSLKKAMNS